MHRPRGLSTRLLVAIGLLAALQLTILVVLLFALHGQRDASAKAAGASSVATAAMSARIALDELQVAERGVAIAGARAPFLDAWQRSAAVLRVRASDLLQSGETMRARAARTQALRMRDYLDRVSAPLARLGQRDPGAARARAVDSNARASAIRTALSALERHERAVRARERDRAASLLRLVWIAGATGIVASLLCALGFLLYVRRSILTPLRGVVEATRALAAGELGARVSGRGGIGEVGELARTFDQMAASLQDSRGALERQNAELAVQSVELVEAVRSAREGTSVLRAVLDATPDAIALLDAQGAVLVDNPPMRDVRDAFGAHATAIDRNGAVVPVHDREIHEERRDEITLVGTQRTFARYAAPVHDGRGRLIGHLLVLREVTGEREAERAKDEFFALVSHELRTPLTAILGYVELMLGESEDVARDGEGALGEEHTRHLEIVERNARRLLRLVGDLLFAAQVEAGPLTLEPGEVDLPQLVRDAIALACPRAERTGIALEATRLDPIEPCVGDRDRLAQVLDNLISNALKFTPPGGRVSVSLRQHDGCAEIEVSDTGAGIPAEDVPLLFDRFYRASNATEAAVPGLGLGLTIVRAIVEGHQGRVAVRSGGGRGTTFTVLLPLQPVPRTEAGEQAARYAAGGR
jgi:signal transduction histidine kinase/HAMP domain-containing protein